MNEKLVGELQDGLASVLGEGGSEVIMKIGQVRQDKFDPAAIDASLNAVFGSSSDGLSAVHRNVLNGMSSKLGVELPQGSAEPSLPSSFTSSLESLAERYRLKEMSGFGVAGLIASLISSICCLGPIAFALMGLASMSASISLAMALTSVYEPFELMAAVGFVGTLIYFQLRRRNECSISGLRRNLGYVMVPTTTMLVSYAVISYWVGVAFFGHPLNPLP